MITLMLTMMMLTMTMMTVGCRYEYTRSNDRMWRKNTVPFLMFSNDADHYHENEDNDEYCNCILKTSILFPFSEFCLFLGGKPWLILHWGRFESQLSWRVRLQSNNDNFNDSLWKNPSRDRYGVGASRDPCSEVFQGSHPFSEAESRALRLKNTHVVILIFQQVLAKFWFLAGTNCCNLQGLPAEPDASESSHLCSFLWQCPYLPLGVQGD